VDGTEYEIDLTTENAEKPRSLLSEYVDYGLKANAGRKNQGGQTSTSRGRSVRTRSWLNFGRNLSAHSSDELDERMGRTQLAALGRPPLSSTAIWKWNVPYTGRPHGEEIGLGDPTSTAESSPAGYFVLRSVKQTAAVLTTALCQGTLATKYYKSQHRPCV
jgi:hypothetical protein